MSNELATVEPQNNPAGFMAVIARAAADPNVNVDKMERLYAMMEKENARIAEERFNEAMAAAQAEMPMVIKKSVNPQTNSKYAKLEAMMKAIMPTIEKYKFSLKFGEDNCPNPSKIRLVCKVSMGGHSEFFHVDLTPDDKGMKGNESKTKIHGEGSTFSYGRRYLTAMIFNLTIVGEDDDGNQGGRARPSGMSAKAAEPTVKELAAELWSALGAICKGDKDWNRANQYLWREEILDGGIPEEAPKLSEKRFKEVIAAVKDRNK